MGLIWPMGRILRIDLTKREYWIDTIESNLVMEYIGGRGFVAKLLADELTEKVGYYDPENPLVFAIGPLTGTNAPVAGRFVAGARSPLTRGYAMSVSGAEWGPALRWSGLHALVITGKAENPMWLSIEGDSVTFRDAKEIWGKDTFEAQKLMKEVLGDIGAQIACIGPAGENLVRYAAIIAGQRAAARCGVGAVMGSKKLKGIALTGIPRGKFRVAWPDKFSEEVKKAYKALKQHPVSKVMRDQGSPFTLMMCQEAGILPTRNFQEGLFEGAELISGDRLRDEFETKKQTSCYRCPVVCESLVRIEDGEYAGAEIRKPEYETLYALGSNCGNSCLESIIFMNDYCNKMGIDTMSLGGVIGFAMECYQRDLINKNDTDGLELIWGNHNIIKKLTDKIIKKEGFGNVLADGVMRASEKIGKGSEKFAMMVKGLELGGYDARGAKGQGLSFATSTRGGCHHAGGYIVGPEILAKTVDRFTTEGKATLVKELRNSRIVYDCATLCTFNTGALGWEITANLLTAALGVKFTLKMLQEIGNRISKLERNINEKYGINASLDTLPWRLLEEAMPEGPSKGQKVELDIMLKEYNELNQ
jgi:aldehyde:ferredoxin oxidoreductase